jgi:hypothetical protein
MADKSVSSHPTIILQTTERPVKYCPSLIEVDFFHVTCSDNIQTSKVLRASKYSYVYVELKNDVFICVEVVLFICLRSWGRASLMYSSTTNEMQRYTMVFITVIALHVSGGSSAHHQELKTVYTASGICQVFSVSYRNSPTIAVRSSKSSTNTRCCVYSFELLMMGAGTA